MASLRSRLILGLVALAAIGLLALGAITYFEQRSFLMTRVDEQTKAAPAAVERAIEDQGGAPGFFDPDAQRRGPHGPPVAVSPPAGTFGERIDRSGAKQTTVFGYVSARPRLPAHVPLERCSQSAARTGPTGSTRTWIPAATRSSRRSPCTTPSRRCGGCSSCSGS
jgi:two-component system OmpR family sensor kinase